jgi:S-adenosylmethionine/arginine decarboxylase-like enzyme
LAGKHLLIDCFGIKDLSKLNNMQFVYDFLDSIPNMVGLIPLGLPHVVKATDKTADGVTGMRLLTTSHASIHTWSSGSRTGQANIDVYSCDDFCEEDVLCEVGILFDPEYMVRKVVRR